MDIIANRIREIRKDNKLSQEQFGKILSVSQDNVSLWEQGKSIPGTLYVIAIAKTFNVTSDYILGLSDF